METTRLNQPLDRQIAEQMIAALHDINNIENNPDRDTKPDDAEKLADAKLFLSNNFLSHASEFLGSWIAVANEYEPLVTAFAALQRRAGSLNVLKMQQARSPSGAQTEPPTKSTVIVPKNFRK